MSFEQRAGPSALDFLEFVERILGDIGPGTAQRRRCFTFDNLTAHTNQAVVYAILAAGHRVVFRAPYYPVDGAIEYVFNSIQQQLTYRVHDILTEVDLEDGVRAIIGAMINFVNYFYNVGFTLYSLFLKLIVDN